MRLLIISLLISAIGWTLSHGSGPWSVWDGISVTSEDAIVVVALLASLGVVEAIWSIVCRRVQLRTVQATLFEAARISEEKDATITTLTAERDSLSTEVERVRGSLVESEARLTNLKGELERQISELKVALTHAEAARAEAVTPNAPGREAIHFLGRLQEKGRFVDFLMEEVGGYTDQQVGAAARFVHDGCRAVVREYLDLKPIHEGGEGSSVTVTSSEQAASLRFIGKSATTYPVTGRLVHKGWRVERASFPELAAPTQGSQTPVLVPAEVELT